MRDLLVLFFLLVSSTGMFAADGPTVRVEKPTFQGPRELEKQTAKAAIQDYIESWRTMSNALDQNRPDLLDRDFIGSAKERLAATIKEQIAAGVRTTYRDHSHDVQILFYSPDGLSIELVDTVSYDLQLFNKDHPVGSREIQARYLVVLTPTEVRWRVRILQSQVQ